MRARGETADVPLILKPSIGALRHGAVVSPSLVVVALTVSLSWLARGHPEVAISELALGAIAVAALVLTLTWSRVQIWRGLITYRGLGGHRSVDIQDIADVQWLRPLSVPALTYCVLLDRESRCRIALVVPFWAATAVDTVIAKSSLPTAQRVTRTVSASRARKGIPKGLPLFLSHPVALSVLWAVVLVVAASVAIAVTSPGST